MDDTPPPPPPSAMVPSSPPQYSPDGWFYWDGFRWVPTGAAGQQPEFDQVGPYRVQRDGPGVARNSFLAGMNGCFGVGAAVVVVIIVVILGMGSCARSLNQQNTTQGGIVAPYQAP